LPSLLPLWRVAPRVTTKLSLSFFSQSAWDAGPGFHVSDAVFFFPPPYRTPPCRRRQDSKRPHHNSARFAFHMMLSVAGTFPLRGNPTVFALPFLTSLYSAIPARSPLLKSTTRNFFPHPPFKAIRPLPTLRAFVCTPALWSQGFRGLHMHVGFF